ncbi:MAG: hypothetical protein ABIU05_13245 [Nitrospirales bacterium]
MNPEKESRAIKGSGGRRPGAGRPLGVPNKLTRPLKELAALHSEDSILVLVALRDHAESEQVRLMAANSLLDRGHGRPRQEINLSDDGKLTVIINRGGHPLDVQPTLPNHLIEEAEPTEAL